MVGSTSPTLLSCSSMASTHSPPQAFSYSPAPLPPPALLPSSRTDVFFPSAHGRPCLQGLPATSPTFWPLWGGPMCRLRRRYPGWLCRRHPAEIPAYLSTVLCVWHPRVSRCCVFNDGHGFGAGRDFSPGPSSWWPNGVRGRTASNCFSHKQPDHKVH